MEVAQNQYKLESQKPQVLYILGGPGSGKGTQCERLVRDYKFEHISVGDVMRTEIKSGSKEGQKISSLVEKGAIVPTELTVGLLLKTIKSRKATRFLIDGFPRGLEQALFLESAFREIDFILNFDVPQEVLIERLTVRALTSGRADDNPETIRNRLQVFYESTSPVLDAYWRIGKVGNISGLGEIEDIYQRVRQSIVPNIIFLYGAPSTGKSTVAQGICQQTGYRYFSLSTFYKVNNCLTEIEKINKLMKFFGDSADRNFVVDSFLENKAQSVVFFEHFGKPRYVVYFQSSKDEIEQNIRQYTKCETEKKLRFQQLQIFLKNRDELLAYFKQFSFFRTINAMDTLQNVIKSVFRLIKPNVLVALCFNNPALAESYIIKAEKQLGYIHLNVDELCQNETSRQTSLGVQMSAFSQAGQIIPAKMQIDLIRKAIFSHPQNTKFLLTTFPEKKQEFDSFEQLLFPIDGLLHFVKPTQKISYSAKINPQLAYISSNKLLNISEDDIELLKAFTTTKTTYGLVIGPSSSGKTTLAKYIGQKYGYTVIEWEPTIASLKEKLGKPGEPLDEVTYPQIVEYYRKFFEPVLTEKYIFDGFPPTCDSKKLQQQFFDIGQPTFIIGVQVSKDALWKRFKLKNELDAALELTPEDDEKITQFLQVGDQIVANVDEYVQCQSGCKLYQVVANNTLEFTQNAIDYIFQKRVFLARNLLSKISPDQLEGLKIVFVNIAAQKNLTFVDVEQLIQCERNSNKVLQNEYAMRWTNQPVEHPSNFTPELVVKLINSYLQSLPTEARDILLWGYPSADHRLSKQVEETFFPRVSDELIWIEKCLGPVRIAHVISEHQLSSEISDPQWELQKPEVKVVQKQDDGDVGDPPVQDGGADGEENKPKFNIYEHSWTRSDGQPKNIAQIYTQLKNPSSELLEVSEYSYKMIFDYFSECLEKINADVSANFFVQIQVQKPVTQ